MAMLDFREIPSEVVADGRSQFELFARECLVFFGFEVERDVARGADSGVDLIVREPLKGLLDSVSHRWLVSCKHFAHQRSKSVGRDDEEDVPGRLVQHGCDGFLAFYSTLPSTTLRDRLSAICSQLGKRLLVLDRERLERELLSRADAEVFVPRFFPDSWKSMKTESTIEALHIHLSDNIELTFSRLALPRGDGACEPRSVHVANALLGAAVADETARCQFAILDRVDTLNAEQFEQLVSSLFRMPKYGEVLRDAIDSAQKPSTVRLLVKAAGRLRAKECCDVICHRVLRDGRQLQAGTRRREQTMRSFFEIAKEALRGLAASERHRIAVHAATAKSTKFWQAKQVFDYAMRESHANR